MSTQSGKERWGGIRALRFADFCHTLQIGPTTGNILLRTGQVRFVWVAGGRRIPTEEVDRLLTPTTESIISAKKVG